MSDIWSEVLSLFPTQSEHTAESSQADLYPLPSRSVIAVTGADSKKFMQGQFTCDLNEISSSQFRRGACCNPKGRMVSSFTLAQWQESHYWLSLDQSIEEQHIQHLKKYMVFFKSKMATDNVLCFGLEGANANNIIQAIFGSALESDYQQVTSESGLAIRLPFDAGYEIWLHSDKAKSTLSEINNSVQAKEETLWSLNLIEHGLASVTQDTVEELIPQMMGLDQTGGVSFKKGCYTGQEIVARMQYLGKLKRHLYRFECNTSACASDSIYTADHASPVGLVVNIAPTVNGSGFQGLAVLEDKYINSHLNIGPDADNPMKLLSLPYAVEAPASE